MSETDKVFTGSIPDIYDEFLVPLIFETYAADLAKRAASSDPQTVLETAAGSGVVTRALAPLLSADARYVVTDLNQPMLDRAAEMQGIDSRIKWQAADALSLPFDDNSFDVVCCQFGVMFFPDRVAGYAEARRVLKPDGRLVFNAWDKIEDNEFADVVTQTASEVFADDPPLFLARTPHGYNDVREIEADLRAAGFDDISIETITETSSAPTARHPAVAYCEGTPLRNEIEARDASRLGEVVQRATNAIATRYGAGPVAAKIQGHVVVATA
ncbi:class I SAM-dependent methyltransferase [Roseibium sp.]|uniref:class I SAM-dependent methyltransferase n=1 Tax=Roseibium sp. TaxID=1936156 RepID=UPI003D0F6CF0